MKKHICAMALTLALAAGGLSLASDLKMADGHILPLGNETVSYTHLTLPTICSV